MKSIKFSSQKAIIAGFLTILYCFPATAQSVCDNALYEADKLYESGKFEECITTLRDCVENQRDREFKTQAFRLLAISHLNLNHKAEAQQYVKALLSLKPDYQKYPAVDPIEFSRLVNSYTVKPRINAGIAFGFNINSIMLEKSYSTFISSQRYQPAGGFQIGITGNYHIKGNKSIYSDLGYSAMGIHHIIDDAGGWKQQYFEQQYFYQFNLGLDQKLVQWGKTDFFAGAGVGLGWMNAADVFMESSNIQTESIQLATRDAIADRNRLQLSGQVKISASRPLDVGMVALDLGFSYYFSTTVNPENRLNDLNFIYNNQYINDDIRMRPVWLNVKYLLPINWEIISKK